ncbi:uncharacterized protein LOC121199555 isoform X3 [Toxotes jaculatrix]|uniref:uncharacterized protein LOC121199555 isoform X3 n=1 Tax=Toxotes jaculatrix TaxID=941984 RepID=UPI001B3B06D0|nr:uncharacterized protein LOC121199555 isoform X3 [Toxotes jaculatrix]
MSATEDDTELRDLLIQSLESNGVLNKLKAEMRAAVFLAMEEQDRLENKTPLINDNLKKCLNTKDGRLVASLIVDFLQVFNLDFTLAVFQPEINSLNGLDSRDLVCRELGLSESEVNRNCPLLLELVRRGQLRDKPSVCMEGDRSGNVPKVQDSDVSQPQSLFPEEKMGCRSVSKIPRYKGQRHSGQSQTAAKDSERVTALGKGDLQQQVSDNRMSSFGLKRDRLDLDLEVEDDLDDGDSFFDDPLPKPQKTYGCRSSPCGEKDSSERTDSQNDVVPLREECLSGPAVSPMRRGKSLNDLSVLAADSEVERDDPLSERGQSSELRKMETSGARESPAGSVSEAPRPGGGGGSSASEQSHSRNGSNSREKELRDPKAPNDRTGSLRLDDDVEYDDDFNSHRSDFSKSELSIGEEIEEVSIEGPDNSDKVIRRLASITCPSRVLFQCFQCDRCRAAASTTSTSPSPVRDTDEPAAQSRPQTFQSSPGISWWLRKSCDLEEVLKYTSQQQKKKMEFSLDEGLGGLSDYEYGDAEFDYDPVGPCSYQNNRSVELVVGPYIHSIICILGFVGNILVIITYAFYKRTKSMTDVYLLNVAVADLLFVASLPLIVYNELSSWAMGQAACKLLRGSYSVNLYSGMLLLACISTDRYIAIVQARRSFRLRSLPYSRLICAIVWVCAFLLSIPTFLYYNWYQPSHTMDIFLYDGQDENLTHIWNSSMYEGQKNLTVHPQYVCEFRFMNNNTAWRTKVAVPGTQLAVGFFLPLLIMIFCYTAVIITLLRARNFQRHKAVRVVLAVVVVFITCHLPYNIVLFYDTVNMFEQQTCEASDALQVAKTVTQTIAYLHCCLNPVLYAFVGVKFRNHFRRIIQDLWCLGKRYIAPRRFSRATSEIYVSARRSVDGSSDNGSSFTM